MLDVFATPQQETSVACPRPAFRDRARPSPSGVRLRSVRYAHHRSASPRRGKDGAMKDNLQKDFYTPEFKPNFVNAPLN